VGQQGVRVWVSFDPFDKVRLAGRPPIPVPEQISPAFFLPSRLDLAGCKGPMSHPESCATSLEVKASPGVDLSLQRLTLDSSVAVVQTRFKPDTKVNPEDPELQGLEVGVPEPFDPNLGLTTVPHFRVATELAVHGWNAAGGPVPGDQVSLKFALRPDPARAPSDVAGELLDWMPLVVERQTLVEGSKSGQTKPQIERLQEQFVRSLSSATVLHKESPVFLDSTAQQRVELLSDKVRHYELKVCAVPRFEETSWEEDATSNNCTTMPVIVLHEREKDPLKEEKIGGAATNLFNKNYEASTGSTNSIKATGRVFTQAGCEFGICSAIAGSTLKLEGSWIDKIDGDGDGKLTLLDFYAFGETAVEAQRSTRAKGRLKLGGFTVWSGEVDLKDGIQKSLPPISISAPIQLLGGRGCIDILCAEFGLSIDPTLSLNTSFQYKEVVAKPGCQGGRITPSGRCFVAESSPRNWEAAEKNCRDLGGHLAEILSPEEQKAALDAMLDKGMSNAWIGALRDLEDCSFYDQGTLLIPTIADAFKKKKELCEISNSIIPMSWVGNGPIAYQQYKPMAPGFTGGMGGSRAGLVLTSASNWKEVNPLASLGYVCEYPKQFDLSATITPGFSLPITVEGSAYLKTAEYISVGAYGTISALNIDFPNTVGLRWSFENLGLNAQKPPSLGDLKLRTTLYYNAKLELSGLDGEVGFKLAGKEYPIIQWDGITYATYDLWKYERTRMLP
jgi:hypothetical protein